MVEDLDAYKNKVTYRPQERVALLRTLSIGEQSTILQSVSPYVQQQVLRELTNREIVDILDHMDLQAAQHLVTRIKEESRRDKIVTALKADIKDKIEFFLRFHPKANFSLVHFNYVYIPMSTTIGEASNIIEQHYEETGKFPEILVHEAGELKGEVSIGALVREKNSLSLEKFIQPVTTITYQAEIKEILDTLSNSGKKKIVVLDNDSSVLGLVYADDALELFGNLPVESLYSFAGVDSSERPLDSAITKFKNRYFWLIVNLVTCFMAGSVILAFQDTVNALTMLTIYIPIVAGMGGNAASQTFAVTLRGITMGTISLADAWPVISRELGAAMLNGLVIGAIVALVSVFWNADPMLGLVVALSMVGVHLVAGLFGALIPLVIKAVGKDPASTSMIFISTTTDVFGLLFLLGLGTWFLL